MYLTVWKFYFSNGEIYDICGGYIASRIEALTLQMDKYGDDPKKLIIEKVKINYNKVFEPFENVGV